MTDKERSSESGYDPQKDGKANSPDTDHGEESNAAKVLRAMGSRAARDTAQEDLSKKKAPQAEEERKTQPEGVIGGELAESSAAKRVRVLTPEDFGSDKADEHREMSFGEKISNFIYHHKWKVIVGAFFALVLGLCVYQLVSKSVPDIYVMYVGPKYVNATDSERINGAFSSAAKDYNNDGKVSLRFSNIIYLNEAQIKALEDAAHERDEYFVFDARANSMSYEKMNLELMTGDSVIYLLDPAIFKNVVGMNDKIFLPLSEVFGEVPDCAIDGFGIPLGETELYLKSDALKLLPPDTVICIRDIRTMSFYKGDEKMANTLEGHKETFSAIVSPIGGGNKDE